ncbi:MAG TPA: MraY family glycosyltransferase [Anaerolineae bacterium]|nr:MraY family glycosyltransferase [Anaerolineae bacterium]HOR00508.1 MraY family glycosyltransferase [Anaerolineae bacterium]HPL30341.1 MraY family glycosyltransferase [Anaerolineae bacterium]
MTTYLLIAVSALVVAAGATPLARRAAGRLGFVDRPAARKLHSTAIPRLGGVAIYLAFIAALAAFGDRFYIRQLAGIFLGATLVSGLGLWDDRQSLAPLTKLAGQLAAAAILIASGVQVQALHQPALNVLVTVLWVVGITNAMNLLDNMDGLSAGVAATAATFFLLLAAMSRQYLVGMLAAGLLGACLGFLVYNVNPASIFMGDSGSLFLGFMLAAVGIKLRFPANVDFVTWMVPVLVLGVPIFDTTLVTVSRLRRRRNPLTTPGKDHTSHRLVALGYTQREAVLILCLISGACGLLATFVTQATTAEGYAVGALAALTGLVSLVWLESRVRRET